MGDMFHRFVQHGIALPDERRCLKLEMPRQRTDAQAAIGRFGYARQTGYSVDIDEQRRVDQPEIQHRDQALPAGQHLCRPVALRKRLNRVLDRTGAVVVERRGFHSPLWSLTPP